MKRITRYWTKKGELFSNNKVQSDVVVKSYDTLESRWNLRMKRIGGKTHPLDGVVYGSCENEVPHWRRMTEGKSLFYGTLQGLVNGGGGGDSTLGSWGDYQYVRGTLKRPRWMATSFIFGWGKGTVEGPGSRGAETTVGFWVPPLLPPPPDPPGLTLRSLRET